MMVFIRHARYVLVFLQWCVHSHTPAFLHVQLRWNLASSVMRVSCSVISHVFWLWTRSSGRPHLCLQWHKHYFIICGCKTRSEHPSCCRHHTRLLGENRPFSTLIMLLWTADGCLLQVFTRRNSREIRSPVGSCDSSARPSSARLLR